MAYNTPWKNPTTHITYKRGDKITVTGIIYNSADGTSGQHGNYTNYACYFYGYYTATWDVKAPVCIGNSAGTAWAFVKPESLKSGGTPESYAITYNGNGGTYKDILDNPWTEYKQYNVKYTVLENWYSRTGYTFSHWNTKKDDTGTKYNAGAIYSGNTALTLYAIWKKISYLISYNANGGTGCPENQTKAYGSKITLSSVIPSRIGYKFVGWNSKADGNGTVYSSGEIYSGNASLTLYAQWEIDNTCRIKTVGVWKHGSVYIKQNEKREKADRIYVKTNGKWHIGI